MEPPRQPKYEVPRPLSSPKKSMYREVTQHSVLLFTLRRLQIHVCSEKLSRALSTLMELGRQKWKFRTHQARGVWENLRYSVGTTKGLNSMSKIELKMGQAS